MHAPSNLCFWDTQPAHLNDLIQCKNLSGNKNGSTGPPNAKIEKIVPLKIFFAHKLGFSRHNKITKKH